MNQQNMTQVDRVSTNWDESQQIEGMRVALSLYSDENNIFKQKFDSISTILKEKNISHQEKNQKVQDIISSQQSISDHKQAIIEMLQKQNKTLLQVLKTKLIQVANFEREVDTLRQRIQKICKQNNELKALSISKGSTKLNLEENKVQIDRLKKEYLILKEESNITNQKMNCELKDYREGLDALKLEIIALKSKNRCLEQEKINLQIQTKDLQFKLKTQKVDYELKIKNIEDSIKVGKMEESQRKGLMLQETNYKQQINKLNHILTEKQKRICICQEQNMQKNIQFMTKLEEKEKEIDKIRKELEQTQLNLTNSKKQEDIEKETVNKKFQEKQYKIAELQHKIINFESNKMKIISDIQQMKGQTKFANQEVLKWKSKYDQQELQKIALMQKAKKYKQYVTNMNEQKILQLVTSLAAKMKPQQKYCLKSSIVHCLS